MTDAPLKAISLFSGYEGFGLGLKLARINLEVVLYVEIDEYAQQIIRARQRDGWLDPGGAIHSDIKTLDGRKYRGQVDIMFGGFPCQPHSVAGNRAGEADERNLWPDFLRVIGDVGPSILYLENVPAINVAGDGRPAFGGTVVGQLSELGYCVEWDVVSAADAGAPHLRKRWWVAAYSDPAGG